MVYTLSIIFFRFVYKYLYKLKVIGTDNIPGEGAIFAPNHVSFLDPFLVLVAIPAPYSTYFFAKKIFFQKPLVGAYLSVMHTFPIDKGKGGEEALRRGAELLEKNKYIVLYPEGTRTFDGKAGPLKRGVAKLVMASDKPIVPTYIEGLYECWPRHKLLPSLFQEIRITFGKAIYPDLFASLSEEDAVDGILLELQSNLDLLRSAHSGKCTV